MATRSPARGSALITGASGGFGAVYADRLARRGHALVLVARDVERLDAVGERVFRDTGAVVETMPADLARAEDLARVEERLRTDPTLTMLVNNAGVGSTAPLLQSEPDTMQGIIDLNVTALTRLTHAAAPAFVWRARGAIVNVASIVALAPELLNGVYGASKAFVLAFSRALHEELSPHGVRVQAVLPGASATDFWRRGGAELGSLPKEIVMSAEDVVDSALAGFDQGELVTIPSLPDLGDWAAFEAARRALVPNLSRATPAARYRDPAPRSAARR